MSSCRIAVLDDYQHVALTSADWSPLDGRATVTVFHDAIADPDALAARLAPFEVVVVMRERTRIDAALIARLPNLKLIAGTGKRNAAIDLAAARARGIVVTGSVGGGSSLGTAVLAFGMMIDLMRGVSREAASVRAGGWQVGLGADLEGATLGLVGLGRVGSRVAAMAAACGMKVIAWSQNLTDETAAAAGAVRVSKQALFETADVVSLHLVLSGRTRGVVGAAELAAMKPSAYLINTARGPLIDEAALIAALGEGRVAGAGLDVFDTEPLRADHPFRILPNVLATPHIGYVTRGVYADGYRQMIANILAFLDGKPVTPLEA